MSSRKIFFIVFLCFGIQILSSTAAKAQGVIPVQHYAVPKLLDRMAVSSSFAYSLRKLRNAYKGFAIKIRLEGLLALFASEANVAFDNAGIVSANSNVTVTSTGGNPLLTVGQVLNFSTFVGTQNVFVTTWYDQGTKAYHATQATASNQPKLVLNTAGGANSKPSIVFTKVHLLDVGQPIQNLVNNGINGSFLLWTKPTNTAASNSFGVFGQPTGWRWSIQLNWDNGNSFFDAAEICCSTNPRSFPNAASVNTYKQYSYVRGSSYKTARVNSVTTILDSLFAPSISGTTGNSFYIGWVANGLAVAGYSGNLTEVVLFPTDLPTTSLAILEADQTHFWSH